METPLHLAYEGRVWFGRSPSSWRQVQAYGNQGALLRNWPCSFCNRQLKLVRTQLHYKIRPFDRPFVRSFVRSFVRRRPRRRPRPRRGRAPNMQNWRRVVPHKKKIGRRTPNMQNWRRVVPHLKKNRCFLRFGRFQHFRIFGLVFVHF